MKIFNKMTAKIRQYKLLRLHNKVPSEVKRLQRLSLYKTQNKIKLQAP